jgi:hypothetical protein
VMVIVFVGFDDDNGDHDDSGGDGEGGELR